MQLKKIVICLLFLFCMKSLFAQNSERRKEMADSVWNILSTQHLTVREQVEQYFKLSELYGNYDAKRTIDCLEKGLILIEKHNLQDKIPDFTRTLGVYHGMLASYDSAKMYLDRSLEASVSQKNSLQELQSYRCIAYLHYRQNHYIQALDNCMQVLRLSEEVSDTASTHTALTNIASLYREMGNYDRALYYIQKDFDLIKKHGTSENLMAYYELGLIYLEKGELDKALEAELKALDFFRDDYKTFEIYCCQAIANIYLKKFDYKNAFDYAEKSLTLSREFSDKRLEAISLQILSSIYLEKKQYALCKTTALKSWEIDSTMLDTNLELTYNIAFASMQLGDKANSAYFFQKHRNVVKERNQTGFLRTMADMEMKYETEKKETRIETLVKQRKFFVLITLMGLIALLLIFGILYYRHRLNSQKRKLAEQQIKQLEQEKKLVATMSVLEGENAERSRLSRDLHDGLGGMLSVIKLNLRNIKITTFTNEKDSERFSTALNMLDKFMEELRRIAHNMMPDSLMRYGIKTSLEDFCRSIPGVNFQFFGENPQLDKSLETLIYRCAYELINNAVRHAEAEQIDVQLTVDQKFISLSVRDDGKGFDTENIKYGAGFINMQHRISIYNGKINIYSSPGAGSEINIEIELS